LTNAAAPPEAGAAAPICEVKGLGYGNYILRRTIYTIIVLFIILSLNFVIFRLMPGDPVRSILDPQMTPEAKLLLRKQFGLDEPLEKQYLLYMRSLLRFDFGYSFSTRMPVKQEILDRLPNSVLLLGLALLITMSTGIVVGVFAASRRGSFLETLVTGSGLFAYAVPAFFLQLILLLVFGYFLPIFPIRGTMSVPPPPGGLALVLDRIYHLILPVTSLVIINIGYWALYTRNAMLDALSQDYIITAKAKGLNRSQVLYSHAFRSILPPIVTLIFLNLPTAISGAVVTETIFSWYGIGRYLLEAVLKQDYPAAQGAFYLIALAVLICNFMADLTYGWVDPRIRVGRGGDRG